MDILSCLTIRKRLMKPVTCISVFQIHVFKRSSNIFHKVYDMLLNCLYLFVFSWVHVYVRRDKQNVTSISDNDFFDV